MEQPTPQHIECTNVFYDKEQDSYMAMFKLEDDSGFKPIIFHMPVNKGDFEVGQKYRLTFKKVFE